MRVDFPGINDNEGSGLMAPPGTHLCEVASCWEGERTRNGDVRWVLKLRVVGGAHAGREVYDGISFGAAALPRVKLVCSRLGIDVSEARELHPDDLRGRQAFVDVIHEDWQGETRAKVPYAGYRRVDGIDNGGGAEPLPAPGGDDGLPF